MADHELVRDELVVKHQKKQTGHARLDGTVNHLYIIFAKLYILYLRQRCNLSTRALPPKANHPVH